MIVRNLSLRTIPTYSFDSATFCQLTLKHRDVQLSFSKSERESKCAKSSSVLPIRAMTRKKGILKLRQFQRNPIEITLDSIIFPFSFQSILSSSSQQPLHLGCSYARNVLFIISYANHSLSLCMLQLFQVSLLFFCFIHNSNKDL